MPPKKVEAAGVSLDIPDQPPSLEADGIVDELLQRAKQQNISGLESLAVQCLRLPNYRYDLRDSIVVDFHVELLLFASEQGYGPKKTLSVLTWANAVRRLLEADPNDDSSARALIKEFLVANVEHSLREVSPSKPEDGQPDGVTGGSSSQAAPAAAGGAKGGKEGAKPPAKGSAPAKEDAAAAAGRSAPVENPHLSIGEIAPLAQFITRGLLQHAQLYANAAANERPLALGCPRTFTFAVEQPMRPLPLSRALTAPEVEAMQRDLDAKAQEELERLQAEEAATLEAARLEEEARLEQQRQIEEEERANQLYFTKAGSAPAVEMVQQEVVTALSQRQLDLLTRVAKLEADLGLVLGK